MVCELCLKKVSCYKNNPKSLLPPSQFWFLLVVWLISHVRLFCDPMDYSLPGSSVHGVFPGKKTGVGSHSLLQGIFPTQGSNPHLLLGRCGFY